MKKIKIVLSILLIVFCIQFRPTKVSAASYSLNVSSTSVQPGQSVSVSVSASGLEGAFNITVSGDASGGGRVWSNDGSVSITAGNSSFTITASPVDVSDSNTSQPITGLSAQSVTVTVVQPAPPPVTPTPTPTPTPPSSGNNSGSSNSGGTTTPTPPPVEETPKSSNNLLGGITLSAGTLSPEFSGDQTEYTVTLPADATSINVIASTQDDTASVSGIGDHALNAGLNSIVLSVTAENGEIRNYTINVNVDETPLIFTNYDENKLGVVRNLDEIGIPDTFEETTVKMNDQDVKAWKSNLLNKTIVFLSNEAGEKSFYVYEDGKGVTSKFTPMGLLGRNLYILDISKEMQEMEGFTYGEVTIDDKKMMGWTFDNPEFANYALIYVMKDNGEMVYYQYESTEKSLQIYSGAVPFTQTELDEMSKGNTNPVVLYILIGGVVVSLGVAGYAVYQLIRTKKYYNRNREGIDQVDEYDDFEG